MPVETDITAALASTAQRLRISAGVLRARANQIEQDARRLLSEAEHLRIDADAITSRAEELMGLTK